MPIHLGKDKKGNFVQWGHRTKYYYTANNKESLKRAKSKCQKQVGAIFANGYVGEEVSHFKEVYDPPYNFEQMREHGYSEKIISKLMMDPVHSWRAKTGIELIHKEPSLAEQKRTWKNWNLMDSEQKAISDQKSIELFGLTNAENYQKTMIEYWQEPITEEILKTDDDIPFIYPQPNLDDQRALWKRWQKLNKKQKALSDKKSLRFFNMTNKDHNDFIFREYWNAPIIAESKFNKLFNLIIEDFKILKDFSDLNSAEYPAYPIKFNNFEENKNIDITNIIKNIASNNNISLPEEVNNIIFLEHFIKSEADTKENNNKIYKNEIHGINYLPINITNFYIGICYFLKIFIDELYSGSFKKFLTLIDLKDERLLVTFIDKELKNKYTVIILISTENNYAYDFKFLTIFSDIKNNNKFIKYINTDKQITKHEYNLLKPILFENKQFKINFSFY